MTSPLQIDDEVDEEESNMESHEETNEDEDFELGQREFEAMLLEENMLYNNPEEEDCFLFVRERCIISSPPEHTSGRGSSVRFSDEVQVESTWSVEEYDRRPFMDFEALRATLLRHYAFSGSLRTTEDFDHHDEYDAEPEEHTEPDKKERRHRFEDDDYFIESSDEY